MHNEFVVGVDLGGTKLYTAVTDLRGRIISEVIIPTEAGQGYEAVTDRIATTVTKVLEEKNVDRGSVKAIGLGIPGQLDYENGVVRLAPNLNWRDMPVQQDIARKTGLPVVMDNDANLAALGEYTYGVGVTAQKKSGCQSLVYITISTGIGGGIVIDGKIMRGAGGAAGEFGHITIEPDGRMCSCGKRGCLEAYASGTALLRQAGEMIDAGQGQLLLKMAGGNKDNINVKLLGEAYRAGEFDTRQIINDAAKALGIALANIIDTIDPGFIVLGGGVMRIGEHFLPIILREAQANSLHAGWSNTEIVQTYLGRRAGVLGACALAIQA